MSCPNNCNCSTCTKIIVKETGLRGPRGPQGDEGPIGPVGPSGLVFEASVVVHPNYLLTVVDTDITGLTYTILTNGTYQIRFDVQALLTGVVDGVYTLNKNGAPDDGTITNKSFNIIGQSSIQNESFLVRIPLSAGDVITVKAKVLLTDGSNNQRAVTSSLFFNKEFSV